ncbi:uncharacterized protein LOC133328223 [Musca vetustissima]|uniref:uncharacterized protein LOC133328223 n=1 Tax=Musca vetustissima TaxID=27455 RepID=UPI002AB7EF55|nr:uncharacterized protein LOC133328223 [Musca vetustissima]
MRTLKGIFQEPKMNHRRDFLRENKLNLRELQKNTTNKLIQKQQELERRQQKYLHRRSDSQQRYESTGRTEYSSTTGMTVASKGTGDGVTQCGGGRTSVLRGRPEEVMRQKQLSFRRSYSQQRVGGPPTNPHERNTGADHYRTANRNSMPRSASVVSVVSKAESCDKEIQTEDILDEEFLYKALKKCSSTEVDYRFREDTCPITATNVHANSQTINPADDNNHQPTQEHISYDYHKNTNDKEEQQNPYYHYSPRSQYSQMPNGHMEDKYNDHEFHEQFDNLQINTHQTRDEEIHSSARSRQTMFSTASKKKSNGNYKFGSRDEIRLPRYLEKEKREKEEERQREMSRDPNCPLGHYAISEDERLAALNAAEKKMESLVLELNRMPMTTETLRIRRRKVEIEKELLQLESDIRIFSKPKVYVPTSSGGPSHDVY